MLLDEKVPGWREEVDPDRLWMGSTQVCVLGQIYGDLYDGLRAVPELLVDGNDPNCVAYDREDPAFAHGILTLGLRQYAEGLSEQDRLDMDYSLLTLAWRRALASAPQGWDTIDTSTEES